MDVFFHFQFMNLNGIQPSTIYRFAIFLFEYRKEHVVTYGRLRTQRANSLIYFVILIPVQLKWYTMQDNDYEIFWINDLTSALDTKHRISNCNLVES